MSRRATCRVAPRRRRRRRCCTHAACCASTDARGLDLFYDLIFVAGAYKAGRILKYTPTGIGFGFFFAIVTTLRDRWTQRLVSHARNHYDSFVHQMLLVRAPGSAAALGPLRTAGCANACSVLTLAVITASHRPCAELGPRSSPAAVPPRPPHLPLPYPETAWKILELIATLFVVLCINDLG